MLVTRTLLSAILAFSLSLLAACSSAPQASTDGIEEIASLAGSDGNLEATLEVVSVTPSSVLSASSDVRSQLVYQKIDFVYKGKPIQGIFAALEGAIHAGVGTGITVQGAGDSGVSTALAKGDRVKIRGQVRKVRGLSVFFGLLQPESGQASAAAVAQAMPVVLVGGNKTLPAPAGTAKETFTDLPISGFVIDLNGGISIVNRSTSSKPFETAIVRTFREPSGLPTGKRFQATLSGAVEVVQTPIGLVKLLTGALTYGQNQSVEVQGFSEVSGLTQE